MHVPSLTEPKKCRLVTSLAPPSSFPDSHFLPEQLSRNDEGGVRLVTSLQEVGWLHKTSMYQGTALYPSMKFTMGQGVDSSNAPLAPPGP